MDFFLAGLLLVGLFMVSVLAWLVMQQQPHQRPRNHSNIPHDGGRIGRTKTQQTVIALALMVLLSALHSTSNSSINISSLTEKQRQIRQGVLPPSSSSTPIVGPLALVEFSNSSPAPMIIKFTGVETHELVVEACATCKVYRMGDEIPPTCPTSSPVGSMALSPGPYHVEMKITSTYKLVGDRILAAGMKYRDCWYLTQ